MIRMHTATLSAKSALTDCILRLVLEPLAMKGMIPDRHAIGSGPDCTTVDALERLVLVKDEGGWAFRLSLDASDADMPDIIGPSAEHRRESAIEAFLDAAKLICEILTGRNELPFRVDGDRLSFMTFGSSPIS